jgi:hypothetical protein
MRSCRVFTFVSLAALLATSCASLANLAAGPGDASLADGAASDDATDTRDATVRDGTSAEGAARDASDANEGTDAYETDAPGDVTTEAEAETDGPQGLAFCEAEAMKGTPHTLCSDFDGDPFTAITGAYTAKWQIDANGPTGTSGTAYDVARQGPFSFRALIPPDATTNLRDTLVLYATLNPPRPPKSVTLATDIRVHTCTPGADEISLITIGVYTGDSTYVAYALVDVGGGQYDFIERPITDAGAGTEIPHVLGSVFTADTWVHFVLDVVLTPEGGTAVIHGDQGAQLLSTSIAGITPSGNVAFNIGAAGHAPFGGCDIAYDDLAIDVR